MESIRKTYKVILDRKVEKQVKTLSKRDFAKVRTALETLSEFPRGQKSIKLTDMENQYRLRVGDFRILYTIEDRILHVYVFDILNRKDAYQ